MVFCAFGGNARGEGDKYSSEADIRDTEATKPSKQQQEAATHARENNTRASGRLHSEARTGIARAFNETRRESMQVQTGAIQSRRNWEVARLGRKEDG